MPCPSCALTGHEDLFAVRRHRIGRGRLLSAAICPGCGFAEAVQRGCCCRRRPVSRCSLGCWLCMMRPMAGCKRCYGGLVGHGDHCISAPLTVQFIGRSSFGQVGQLTRELPLRMTACRFFEHWHFKMERPGSALWSRSRFQWQQQVAPVFSSHSQAKRQVVILGRLPMSGKNRSIRPLVSRCFYWHQSESLVDFDPFPGAGDAERNGRKRENQAQNGLDDAAGEVRKFPHEPATTRGNTRDRPRKNPNSDELGFLNWWSWGDSNPRPQAFFAQFYMCSRLDWISPGAPRSGTLRPRPATLDLVRRQVARRPTSRWRFPCCRRTLRSPRPGLSADRCKARRIKRRGRNVRRSQLLFCCGLTR